MLHPPIHAPHEAPETTLLAIGCAMRPEGSSGGAFFCGGRRAVAPDSGAMRIGPRRWPCGSPRRRVKPPAMPRVALFPGSFDPVTNGHVDLVRQSLRLADRLVLAIGTHPGKAPLCSTEDRLAMLEAACGPLARAAGCELRCITFADLVVAAARREGASLLIRGLRGAAGFDYEMEM